jgi:hypothetical protein
MLKKTLRFGFGTPLLVGLLAGLLVGLLAGCATTYRKNMESRGYVPGEIDEVDKQQTEFYNELFYYQQGIGKHNTAQAAATQTKITGIYCACVKKLGEKCQKSGQGLAAADHSVWVKGNAAEGALATMGSGNKPEPSLCSAPPAP